MRDREQARRNHRNALIMHMAGRINADDIRTFVDGHSEETRSRTDKAEQAAAKHQAEADDLRAALAATKAEHEQTKATLAETRQTAKVDLQRWNTAVKDTEAQRDAAIKARTTAEAETAELRAALEAHTLRARLARWLVRV